MFDDPASRRLLRLGCAGDPILARRLLTFRDDLRRVRQDSSLATLIRAANLDDLIARASDLAAGAGASALWERLARDADLQTVALAVVQSGDAPAAATTLQLLVLDPLDDYLLTREQRRQLAVAAITQDDSTVASTAAEYLAVEAPEELAARLPQLTLSSDQHLRGVVWSAALHADRTYATDLALDLLGDEAIEIACRRSALNALGQTLPTSEIAPLLSLLVVHPERTLAEDAAALLFRLHRNPDTAMAATQSPHADVRELAERLLDPLRGSPAAGGSRPGDPTRGTSDIFDDLVAQLETATGVQDLDDKRNSH